MSIVLPRICSALNFEDGSVEVCFFSRDSSVVPDLVCRYSTNSCDGNDMVRSTISTVVEPMNNLGINWTCQPNGILNTMSCFHRTGPMSGLRNGRKSGESTERCHETYLYTNRQLVYDPFVLRPRRDYNLPRGSAWTTVKRHFKTGKHACYKGLTFPVVKDIKYSHSVYIAEKIRTQEWKIRKWYTCACC